MSPFVREPRDVTITYGRPPWPPELLAARLGDIVTVDEERWEFRGLFTRPRAAAETWADGPSVLVVGLREILEGWPSE